MKSLLNQLLVVIIFYLANPTSSWSQKSLILVTSNDKGFFVSGMPNSFSAVAQQENEVSLNQLSAVLEIYDPKTNDYQEEEIQIEKSNGIFFIQPRRTGWLYLSINLGDTTEVKKISVKPLPAVGLLCGSIGANSDKKISPGAFKAQEGIIPEVQGFGCDCKCSILDYELIRIDKNNTAERLQSKGTRFGCEARELIMKAASGDLYIFRKIHYRCPGNEYPQRLGDTIFEIGD